MLEKESEQFKTVLAEALRAGPASPSWRQAVELLQAQGHGGDEWSLLVRARERLENGRGYRTVRPGAGFTRRLMQRIDEVPQASPHGIPTASLVTAGAALIIVAVVGFMAWLLFSPALEGEGRVDLRDALFVNTLLSQDFDETIPSGWRRLGGLSLSDKGGLRLVPPPTASEDYMGGGLLLPLTLAGQESFELEATIEWSGHPLSAVAQLFVSESDSFSADRGTSPRELVVQVEQKGSRVVLAGGQGAANVSGSLRGKTIKVRLLVSRDKCLVEQDGHTLFAGEHLLAWDKPRYLGVRLLGKGALQRDAVTIHSVSVRKP